MKHNKLIILTIIMFILLLTGCGDTSQADDITADLTGSDFVLSLVNCGDAYISADYNGYDGHKGVDIAAPEGCEIYAADDGVVDIAIEMNMGYGIHCVINHEGYETLYAHCQSLAVKKGDVVRKGDVIGHVGNTGQSTGPHLHFEVICDSENQNPTEWYK